jgi:hypothetical protein
MRVLQIHVEGGSSWRYRLGEEGGDGIRALQTGELRIPVAPTGLHLTIQACCDEDQEWSIEWRDEGATPIREAELLEVVRAAASTLPAPAFAAWQDALHRGDAPSGALSLEGWHVVC